jgi:hypothetical protein
MKFPDWQIDCGSFWRMGGLLSLAPGRWAAWLATGLMLCPVVGSAAGSELAGSRSEEAFFQRFQRELWPLLTRGGEHSCVSCHDADNRSPLHFFSEPHSDFRMLRENAYFSATEPDTLLGRLTSTNPKKRMPKGKTAQPWSDREIQALRSFAADLNQHFKPAAALDEQFPSALLLPYSGPISVRGRDNQFLTYRQLKGKIKTIFDDDWVRNGRDLFQENIALFGGADFKERFNETAKASPTFFTGLDMLSRDVAARAYASKVGPFAGHPESLPSPLGMDGPDAAYAGAISKLYEKILFRSPDGAELNEAFALLRNIYRSAPQVRASEFELSFNLTVQDVETGLKTVESLTIPVAGGSNGLFEEYLDESRVVVKEPEPSASAKPATRKRRSVSGEVVKAKLDRTFHFRAHDPTQTLRVYNANTVGNVSFQAVELRRSETTPAASNAVLVVTCTNTAVQAEGAWKLEQQKGLTSFEDENNAKGSSSIQVAVDVPAAGEYEVTLCWRQGADNARAVLVEVLSDDPSRLASASIPPVPGRGQAQYFIDESNDSIAFAELQTLFRFGPRDYVEINNRDTHRRVTADAVRFVSARDKASFLVDNDEAEGRENWKVYDSGPFQAYNLVGKDTYHDENARKGELFLRYLPSLRTNAWNNDEFYQVAVGYPAKQDHEFHTPVVVKAQQSSPIIRIGHPFHAQIGAQVELDASRSYTVQGSQLRFSWEQTGGPAVDASDRTAPVLRFTVPRMGAPQAAWEALARALMQHPDFLFTRPPSALTTRDAVEWRRLQLVKVAQDLMGRPPTQAELRELAGGKTLPQFVDCYMGSEEFKDFYFHRIRLYLESHGTEVQDEPGRLWCYIASHDLPFGEILTADYTVDARWQKQSRPSWCGHTGVLTTRGFIEGKPGLPHFNYAAQVAELFLGYVFEVPPEVVAQREGITAASTTDPSSVCYSCHKILTPLAFQRTRWDDLGRYRYHDEYGLPIDDSDQHLVASYPFAGNGLEAFTLQAVKKERFIRTILNTHATFYFGREMRWMEDERTLYKRLWDEVHRDHFTVRGLIKAIVTSPEYLGEEPGPVPRPNRITMTMTKVDNLNANQ